MIDQYGAFLWQNWLLGCPESCHALLLPAGQNVTIEIRPVWTHVSESEQCPRRVGSVGLGPRGWWASRAAGCSAPGKATPIPIQRRRQGRIAPATAPFA